MQESAADAAIRGGDVTANSDTATVGAAAATTAKRRWRLFSALRMKGGAGGKEFRRIGGIMIVARVA